MLRLAVIVIAYDATSNRRGMCAEIASPLEARQDSRGEVDCDPVAMAVPEPIAVTAGKGARLG